MNKIVIKTLEFDKVFIQDMDYFYTRGWDGYVDGDEGVVYVWKKI